MFPGCSGATAPWVARAGKAPGSKTFWTRSALKRRRSKSSLTARIRAFRQDPRLHQEHSDLEGDRGHHARGLRNEWGAAAAPQWLPGASHRAGLDRNLLDEASHLDQAGDQARKRILDDSGVSHTTRQVPDSSTLHLAGNGSKHAAPRY